jgi:hypothetical protein
MTRFMSALLAAVTVSSAGLFAQAQAPVSPKTGTERISPQAQTAAKNLMADVTTVGCIRLWRPAPDDPTKMPLDRQPGLAGVYLLTPISSDGTAVIDLPTYLLTPSGTLNFSQHVGHQVQISGTAQTAPLPPTVQEIATAPTLRPENKPSTNGMPRLTATTMKLVSESCP